MKTMKTKNEAFPERLRSLIAKEKISQVALADHLGITRGAVNAYIQGRSEPGLQYLVAIAQYFGVSTDYLIGNTTVVEAKRRPPVSKTE